MAEDKVGMVEEEEEKEEEEEEEGEEEAGIWALRIQ